MVQINLEVKSQPGVKPKINIVDILKPADEVEAQQIEQETVPVPQPAPATHTKTQQKVVIPLPEESENVTRKARCLIKNLLRREPQDRLSADQILKHPWFTNCSSTSSFVTIIDHKNMDQMVPNMVVHEAEDNFFV